MSYCASFVMLNLFVPSVSCHYIHFINDYIMLDGSHVG